jgi:hypothetical protein
MLVQRLLRRGLFRRLQWYSKANTVGPTSNSINALYADPAETAPADPAGALREFYKEDLTAKKMAKPVYSADPILLSLQSVLDVIHNESNAEITTYENLHSSVDLQTPAQIVLQLETVRERVSLGELLLKKVRLLIFIIIWQFRPFLKDNIYYEGLGNAEPDWIVLDLQVARVHIFSPEARIDYGIDEKFQSSQHEAGETPEEILEKIAESVPRRIAGDPSVSFIKNRDKEKDNPFL